MMFDIVSQIIALVKGLLPPLAACPHCGGDRIRVHEDRHAAWMQCERATYRHRGPLAGTPRAAWLAWNHAADGLR
jgi:hypothetical protein